MTRLKIIALALVCLVAWATVASAQVDDSVAKYGQEFKGKIAESYAESEE